MEKVELGLIGEIIKRCVICHAGEIIYVVDIEEAEIEIIAMLERLLMPFEAKSDSAFYNKVWNECRKSVRRNIDKLKIEKRIIKITNKFHHLD